MSLICGFINPHGLVHRPGNSAAVAWARIVLALPPFLLLLVGIIAAVVVLIVQAASGRLLAGFRLVSPFAPPSPPAPPFYRKYLKLLTNCGRGDTGAKARTEGELQVNDSRRISGAMIVLSMLVPVANAQSIYDSGGFDNPSRFTTGTIVGQDTGVAFWGTSGENGNSATVQSDAAAVSPPRDVVVNYQNAFGALWWPETSRVTPTAAEPYVLITWDEKVPATGVGGDGPYFGVNAYAAVGTIGAANGAAHLFVDADARQVSYFSTTGLRGLAAVDTAWHHYMLALNFQTQQFSAYFDGTALLTNVAFLNGGDTFVDAAIWIPQGNPSDPSANAYFDNFTESLASSVPEPSGVVVACLAGLMLLRRRSSI